MYRVKILKVESGKEVIEIFTHHFDEFEDAAKFQANFNKRIPRLGNAYFLAKDPNTEFKLTFDNVILDAFYTIKRDILSWFETERKENKKNVIQFPVKQS